MSDQAKFVLRQPQALYKKIKRAAKSDKMSMNQYICNTLADSFSKPSVEMKVDELIFRLEKQEVI